VSPVRYELGFYIPEDDILHSHRRENLKSYIMTVLFNAKYGKECTHAELSANGRGPVPPCHLHPPHCNRPCLAMHTADCYGRLSQTVTTASRCYGQQQRSL
jgi:hypothetical protein